MKVNILHILRLIIIIMPSVVQAQVPFTLQQAIDTALRNNFDIRIAKNNLEMAKISNSFGMAGGLPVVSVNAGDNISNTYINQQFADGTESDIVDQRENVINAGVTGSMVLFNGFRVIATKERLERLQNQSEIALNLQIQNVMADVMISYSDVVRQQNYLKTINHLLGVSEQKLEIVKVRNRVGMADAAAMLQAVSDVNSAKQLLESQEMVIRQTKMEMLLILGVKHPFVFEANDKIEIDTTLRLESILNRLGMNPQFQNAEQQVLIEEQLVREVSAQRYPSVKLNAGYDFYQADVNKGNLLMNRFYGPVAGITLQVPVFNGFIYKNQKDLAKIRVENSILEKESLINSLNSMALKTYLSYSTTLYQIKSQETNFELARQLVEVVMQKFNLGQATILDVKAAQTSFENAAYLLDNLKFSAKVAEIGLKQLTYSLEF
ncbi:MAG: outer membrane efflux protein [Bacteroidetes bacterium]|nr:MAG: outer membrane efflux protein [Bacteroidota bacterium]